MLESDRLLLRPFHPTDVEDYYRQIYSDPDVLKTLPFKTAFTLKDTQVRLQSRLAHWQTYGFGVWALIHRATEVLIGHCGLQYLEYTPEVEITYAIATAYWGQGLATEAAQFSLQWGFKHLSVAQIVGITQPTNWASQRVLQKLGMTYQKEAHHYGCDVVYYAILREEFTSMR